MLFDNSICQLLVPATPSYGLSTLSQQKTFAYADSTLKGEEDADTSAFDRSVNADDAVRYVTSVLLDSLHSLILDCNLYSNAGNGLSKCRTFHSVVGSRKVSKSSGFHGSRIQGYSTSHHLDRVSYTWTMIIC